MPDNAWALDARDGHEIWHYFWKTRGGTHIANRGLGMWNNYLYMETPDNYLVSLDAGTGKERWHKVIADLSLQYFSTTAPVIVDKHVLVGTGNDLDAPGFLQSFDAETGDLKWKFYTVPMNPGDPGAGDVAEPGCGAPRRRPALAARRVRSRDQALHLRYRQSDAGLHARTRRRRQSVHVLARRRQRGHREDGVVLPDVAARHARLGLGADADPDRRRDQRPEAEARLDGRAQRIFLHARPRDRRAHRHQQVRHLDELGEERRAERIAQAQSGEGPHCRRRARVADCRRDDQLGAARVLARHRPVLRFGEKRVLALLPDRTGSSRLDGPRRPGAGQRRVGWKFPHRDRLPKRKGRLASSVSGSGRRRRGRRRAPDHRGRPRVRGGCRRQHRGLRRRERDAVVAFAHRQRHERAADLHARRPSVPARRRGRYAL